MFLYFRRTAEQKGSHTHHDRVRNEIQNSTVDSTSRSEREFEVPVPETARVPQKSVKVPLGHLFFALKSNDFKLKFHRYYEQVRHFDMVMQAVSILEDETLQDGFMELPDIRGTGDSRVFGELNTGFWWESTQEDAPEVIFVHILMIFHQITQYFCPWTRGPLFCQLYCTLMEHGWQKGEPTLARPYL